MIPIVVGALGMIPKRLGNRNGRIGNQRKNGDHHNYNIFKNGQNTEEIPGNMR